MEIRDIQHFFEDFNLAQLWEKHRAPTLAAGAVLVLVPVLLFTRCGGESQQRASSGRYFFDLNTGQLVVDSDSVFGPVDLGGGAFDYPDGEFGSAVRARVISCNDCVGIEAGMTLEALQAVDANVAYLSRMPPRGHAILLKKQAGETLTSEDYDVLDRIQWLYSDIAGKTWLSESSTPAQRLIREARGNCADARARVCSP